MKLIYVAGPYSAGTAFGIKQNILIAERTAMEVCKLNMNAFPVTPHLNTPFGFEGLRNGQYFIDGTMKLMLLCNALLLVLDNNLKVCVNYGKSVGTTGEVKAAHKAGIPVFTSLLDLRVWLAKEERKPEKESFMQRIRKHFYE